MPLPDAEARKAFLEHKLKDAKSDLTEDDIAALMQLTEGYSCADLN